jgi:hypothetical protein
MAHPPPSRAVRRVRRSTDCAPDPARTVGRVQAGTGGVRSGRLSLLGRVVEDERITHSLGGPQVVVGPSAECADRTHIVVRFHNEIRSVGRAAILAEDVGPWRWLSSCPGYGGFAWVAVSSWSPGVAWKMPSLDTNGTPSRRAVAAIQRSASCSRWLRAWPMRSQSTRRRA